MRIVQLANFYSATSGGLRTALEELGRRYGQLGHDRVLVVPGASDRDEETPAGRRVTVRSPALPGGVYRVLLHRRRVLDLLDRLRPDVLEVSDKLCLSWLAPWSWARGVPAVLFSHERLDSILADRVPTWFPLAPAADRINLRLARSVHQVVVASRYGRAEYERIGVPNVRLVPLGVDLDLFRPDGVPRPGAGRSVQLVTVGRLSREKRPELAIETLRALRADGVPAGLLVIGDGPLRTDLVRQAAGLPVRFLGHVADRRGVARLVAAADIALAPCPVETFGLAVLESLAAGTPVVVPAGGAASDLLGAPESGAVTDGTAAGLAAGVHALLDVPAADRRAAARARATDFPWSATVTGLLAVHAAAGATAGPRSVGPDDEVLDHRVGEQPLGQLGDPRVVERPVDLQLEVLALADAAHPAVPHPTQCPEDRLPLRVEDLRLEHDVDDHAWHSGSQDSAAGFRARA
ncbi:MAG: alpha,6-mannosyltransferase [Mycobacteriales bacterium]